MQTTQAKFSKMAPQYFLLLTILLPTLSLLATLRHQASASSFLMSSASQQQLHQYQSTSQTQQQQQQLQQETSSQQLLSITPFAFNSPVQENQKAMVMCTTSSGEITVAYQWLKDNQLLTPQIAQARRITIKSDQDSSTLKITSVRLDHAGNYTCIAKNRLTSQAHSAQLVVHGEPRWLRGEPQHEPIVATKGQLVVIDCQTTGWPRPEQSWHIKTHWQADFEQLLAGGGSSRYTIAPNGSLIIRNADKSDEANYLCKSSNGIGKGLSWSTSLKVTVPAHFEQPKQQMSIVRKQSQVQLRCDALGDQPLTIEWFKNKQPLVAHESEQPRYSVHSNVNPLKGSGGLISQLLIKRAQRQDNAIYECVTRNAYGRDRLPLELVVQEEPDVVQELQVTQTNSRSVTLMWSEPYDGRSPITSYTFQYKRVRDETHGAVASPSSTSGPVNAGGSEFEFLTGTDQMSDAEPTGGSYDWQQAARLVMNVDHQTVATANSSSSSASSPSVKSITIDKLEPSSRYLLRAFATNSIGQSKFSVPMEFTTEEEAPEVGPVNIRALALNSTSILVSWDEIVATARVTGGRGRIHGYYVGYRVASNMSAASNFLYKPFITSSTSQSVSSASAANEPQVVGSVGSAISGEQQSAAAAQVGRLETIISDLKRDTIYEITVVAFNSRGSGPSSDFVVCRTTEMEAPKAVRLTIRRESNESIFIEWHRDPLDQNPIDDYVLYQEKNSATQEWLSVRLPGNQTQYKAPGLKCGTRYQFYIIAHNKAGKSPSSEVVGASTSGALPVIPSKMSLIKMVNSTCLLINLNAFQDNGCRIRTFTLRYRAEKSAAAVAAASSVSGAVQPASAQQLVNSNGISAASQALSQAASGHHHHHSHHQTNGKTGATTAGGLQSTGGSGLLQGPNGAMPSGASASVNGLAGGQSGSGSSNSGNNQQQPVSNEWLTIRPRGVGNNGNVLGSSSSGGKYGRFSNEEERNMELLCDLNPVGEYTIHVAAANDVGRSEMEYSVLMSSDELRHSALRELIDFALSVLNVFAYIPSIFVFLFAGLALSVVSLILYTTAIKYYQKFVIMQNQMRATRRAKADEKRRRKLANQHNGSLRQSQKMDLWADEFDEDDEDEDGDDEDAEPNDGDTEVFGGRNYEVDNGDGMIMNLGGEPHKQGHRHRRQRLQQQRRLMGVDDGVSHETASSFSASSSSSSANSAAAMHRGGQQRRQHARNHRAQRRANQQAAAAQAAAAARAAASAAAAARRYHYTSGATHAGQHYLSNIANSAFDTSSIDSPCNGQKFNGGGSTCMSTASTDSIHGRFQCLNAKQYVKMNEYTMLPSISSAIQQANSPANDIYGTASQVARSQALTNSSASPNGGLTATAGGPQLQRQQPPTATQPGAGNAAGSLYHSSTLRRTNMQTYLPHQSNNNATTSAATSTTTTTNSSRTQQQQINRRHSQNVADIYGYYIAPQAAQAQAAAVVAAQAQAVANQQAANEAANSIFVPPQQIIYSAPNIRRQPPVFL